MVSWAHLQAILGFVLVIIQLWGPSVNGQDKRNRIACTHFRMCTFQLLCTSPPSLAQELDWCRELTLHFGSCTSQQARFKIQQFRKKTDLSFIHKKCNFISDSIQTILSVQNFCISVDTVACFSLCVKQFSQTNSGSCLVGLLPSSCFSIHVNSIFDMTSFHKQAFCYLQTMQQL